MDPTLFFQMATWLFQYYLLNNPYFPTDLSPSPYGTFSCTYGPISELSVLFHWSDLPVTHVPIPYRFNYWDFVIHFVFFFLIWHYRHNIPSLVSFSEFPCGPISSHEFRTSWPSLKTVLLELHWNVWNLQIIVGKTAIFKTLTLCRHILCLLVYKRSFASLM